MKITLIYPPCIFSNKEQIIYSHCLGVRSLSSFLKTKGRYEVNFVNALMLGFKNVKPYSTGYIVGLEIDEIVSMIPLDTELVGISAPFSILAPVAHDIIDKIKSRLPNALTVMGGIYPSTQPYLALTSKVDFIVVGEGELALSKIAAGENPEGIKGVYSRKSANNKVFPGGEIIEDLDSLPFPDYSIPMMDEYFNLSPRRVCGRTASLFTSRGCPFSCEFCSIHPVYGRLWRARSPENVLAEIEYLIKNHSINSIEFEDDNFTLECSRTIGILEGIINLNEKGFNLNWRTPNGIRIDTLDKEIIMLMKRANCAAITLALEHGDSEMIQIMNKNLDLDKAFKIIELMVKYKIPKITLFLIAGYPGETKERFLNSVKYLKKIHSLGGNISVIANMAQPYPGTKLLARCKARGYIQDENFDNFLIKKELTSSRHYVSVITPDFDAREVLERKSAIERIFN